MKLTIHTDGHGYDVVLKRGTLQKASSLTNLSGRVLVVTDQGIPQRYVQTLVEQCGEVQVLCLPCGEKNKTPETGLKILQALWEYGYGRDDVVVALGGGCVCSLAGYAAGQYMGGVPLVLLPTTVMAQADAALGGEHRLNLAEGCNLVRVLHQPSAVLADPDVLDCLPARERAAGFASALKMGMVGSTELFEALENMKSMEGAERIIFLAMLYKKSLIEHDEAGAGQRQLLEFGHLVADAIAATPRGNKLPYGECLAWGMLPVVESRSLVRRCQAVQKKLDLPLVCPVEPDAVALRLGQSVLFSDNAFTVARVKTLGRGYLDRVSREELELLIRDSFARKDDTETA